MSEPEMIERDARIFRFGDFPDRDWSITADEFLAANAGDRKIPIGMDPVRKGHYEGGDSWLDGETGTAAFSVQGDEVRAKLLIPDWVDRVVRKHEAKISAVFDRVTKAIKKIDFVRTPRIKDAVLFAQEHGEVVLFDDDEPGVPVVIEFAHDPDGGHDHAQMAHDLASHYGPDLCSGKKSVHFSKETDAERGLRVIHDHAIAEGGAYCPGMGHKHGEVGMSDELEELQAKIDRLEQEAKDREVAFADQESPREKALREKLERLEAKDIETSAVAFADSVTTGKEQRAYFAERPSIIAGFKRAAQDDAKLGDTVTFADDKGAEAQGSRLDAFKAGFKVRPVVREKRDGETVGFDLSSEPSATSAAEKEIEAKERAENIAAYNARHPRTVAAN